MCDEMPKCPYGQNDCPGSSDDAWVYFEEDGWVLDQWQCTICRCEDRIANTMPLDDDDDDRPSEDDDERSEYLKEEPEPAL